MTYISDHRADHTRAYFWLLEFQTGTPYYATDCDQPLTYDGHVWLPQYGVAVSSIKGDDHSVLEAQVEVVNENNLFGVLVSGLVGASLAPVVVIHEAWVNPQTLAILGSETICKGRLDRPEWTEQRLKFSVANGSDSIARKLPAPFYSNVCWYREFGPTGPCQYGGDTTGGCPRTWDFCNSIGNQSHFGGYIRMAPSDGLEFYFQVGEKHTISSKGCS
jgi:hypothetical protein